MSPRMTVVGHYSYSFCFPPAGFGGTLGSFLRVLSMPQTDYQSLPLIIQDLILDHQIRNLDATFISRAEGVFSVSRDRSFTYIVPDGNSRVDWLAAMEDKAHDPRFGFTARDGEISHCMIVPLN